jgi:hypothetical protein
MKEAVAVEREVPDVTEGLDSPAAWAMQRVDPVAELAKFEAAAELMKKLIPASIRATRSQDWVKMGNKVYLQATGVERLAPLWGLVFGTPKVVKEPNEDGSYSYIVTGPAYSRRTGVGYQEITGGRSSSDPFFGDDADPLDIRKAAVTNWMTRAASMLTGLRGLTQADLDANGVTGVAEVNYKAGGKGGSAVPADLAAKRTAFWNELVRRAGGDLDIARSALKDCTKYDAYTKKDGSKVPAFDGATSMDRMSETAINIATDRMKKHPVVGDEALASGREPGQEG